MEKIECIHYNHDGTNFNIERFDSIKNSKRKRNKPFGGFWCSPINSQFGWEYWCISENFKLNHLKSKIKINVIGNIMTINSYKDLKTKMIFKNDQLLDLFHDYTYIDYEQISANGIDAIYLSYRGLKQTSFSFPINLWSWSCESVLVLNPFSIHIV